ncbi:MAG: PIN domain-containing protein [Candidatus Diapherotrites archaeon]|nr:PIN domain-containing protein [Candidatus Diapherotrites archaeon]
MIADSSFLVALTVKNDSTHLKAVRLFSESSHFLVPSGVLEETLTVLVYNAGIPLAREFYSQMMQTECFEIYEMIPEEKRSAVSLLFDSGKKISFVDSCVIYLSLQKKQSIASFDRELLKLAGQVPG